MKGIKTKYTVTQMIDKKEIPVVEVEVDCDNDEKYKIKISSYDKKNGDLTNNQLLAIGDFFTKLSMAISLLFHTDNKEIIPLAMNMILKNIYSITELNIDNGFKINDVSIN